MKFVISETQLNKMYNLIQGIIDKELLRIRRESEDWGLGEMDELDEIESIDKIIVKNIDSNGKNIKVYVDIHRNSNRYDFDNVLRELEFMLGSFIPDIKLIENDIIDTRTSGPGIDW